MRKRDLVVAILAGCSLLPAADWLTDGGNPQRTGWQKDEKILSKSNVAGMKAIWKIQLDNQVRELHALFPPLIINSLNFGGMNREVAIVSNINDNIYAIDVAKGEIIWKKHFDSTWTPPAGGRGGGPLCPGGQTATPIVHPAGAPGKYTIFAISWDGRLRQLNASDGEYIAPPVNFVPPNGKPYSLNIVGDVLYTTTAQGCGGNPNRVYTMDLKDPAHKVNFFGTSGGSWGRSGPAVDEHGVAYAPTGDGNFDPSKNQWAQAIVAVNKDGSLKDYYAPSNAQWMWKMDLDMQVTPTLFEYKGKKLLATSSKECRIFLLDRDNLGGADHRTPVFRTTWMCNEEVNFAAAGVWGSLATWENAQGVRYVLSPIWGPVHPDFKAPVTHGVVTHGAIVAWKVEQVNGKIVMTPAWISRDMDQAEPPVVANGVVYAYGNGESSVQATPELGLGANQSSIRIKNSTRAVLYALDAETGKELWNSGDEIKSFGHFTGLSIANGRVYLGTFDNVLYSFGLPAR
jgi:outer membrane protein assembly factor BamB